MADKKVLVEIDNVRIREYDSMNVVVERFEETYNPFEKKNMRKWQFKGYSPSVFDGLKLIAKKELLIDKNAVSDLKSYLNEVRKSNYRLLNVVGGIG